MHIERKNRNYDLTEWLNVVIDVHLNPGKCKEGIIKCFLGLLVVTILEDF
jgi:hypothetical protein